MPSLREKLYVHSSVKKPSCDQNEVTYWVSLRSLKLMFLIGDGLGSSHI